MKKKIVYSILNSASWMVGILGFRGIYCLSWLLGGVCFDVLRLRRKVILHGIDLAHAHQLTAAQERAIGRESVRSFCRTSLEFLGSAYLLKKARFKITCPEVLSQALGLNQGVYALGIHMSNFHFLCSVCSTNYASMHVVTKIIGKHNIDSWVEDLRTGSGYYLVNRKGSVRGTTQIFQSLEKNQVIGFAVDQKRPRGQFVPFFGKPASTNDSLARLWLKKQAPIVPMTIHRTGMREFNIVFYPQMHIDSNELQVLSHAEKVNLITIQMNQCVEKMILENPSEYLWMHNRWDV